jgi:hypothetical protein
MSGESAFSMNELELESAELLPIRETLCRTRSHGAPSSSFSQTAGAIGLVNVLSGDNINVNVLGVGF